MNTTNATPTRAGLTTAQVNERTALERVCHYGPHTIGRHEGLFAAYKVLAKQGKITLTSIGAGRWRVMLDGALRDAYLAGEDMEPFARGEA